MQIESDFEFQIKIIVIGDSSVGKTNFIFRFIEGKFNPAYVTTVGFDYKSKIIKLPKSKKRVKVQIWDTAGQERYNAINKNLFQKVQGVIIMYDITNRSSFDNISKWLNLLSQSVSNRIKMLVGNKLDLSEEKRIVTEEEGRKFAEKYGMHFLELTSTDKESVNKSMLFIIKKILNLSDDFSGKIMMDSKNINEKANEKENEKQDHCCCEKEKENEKQGRSCCLII